MKISKETLEILQNFSTINESIMVFQGNRQRTFTKLKVVYGEAIIQEEFPRDFAIYELPTFLGLLSLFKDPELTFSDTKVTIQEGSHTATYRYCNPSLIVHPDKEKNLQFGEAMFSFELSAEHYRTILKAVSLYQQEYISIDCDGTDIVVRTMNPKDQGADYFSHKIGESDQKFRIVLKVENLKFLPHSYDVTISKNRLVMFRSKNMNLFYAVPAEANFSGI
jgi:hypothetical protein